MQTVARKTIRLDQWINASVEDRHQHLIDGVLWDDNVLMQFALMFRQYGAIIPDEVICKIYRIRKGE